MPAEGNKVLVQGSKMLSHDNLRLIALALIAETPRYGYEIIKLIEEKTADWHSPTPNIVYPMLTNLKAAGYLTASTEGPRRCTRSPTRATPISSRITISPMPCSTA